MCGRFALGTAADEVAAHLDASPLADVLTPAASWNIAPTDWVPIIVGAESGQAGVGESRHVRLMRWGFLPHWAKGLDARPQPINARSEGIREKRMFSTALRRHRCLVPALGWYEWLSTPAGKSPFWFHSLDDAPLTFAGVHSLWTAAEGAFVESFAIITAAAADNLSSVHDRMPALIAPNDRGGWLDGDTSKSEVDEILEPERIHDCAVMIDSFAVSKRVNDARNDGADLIVPLDTLPSRSD